ncbi:MAG: hypothetical protein KKI08_27385, partial [Armatimonadetes bacterium]|nr:hypothetical protein [Armatimonadota bacterium]
NSSDPLKEDSTARFRTITNWKDDEEPLQDSASRSILDRLPQADKRASPPAEEKREPTERVPATPPPVEKKRNSPARVLAATLRPVPAMSTAAHLPAPTVTLAGARISRPDSVAEPIAVTPPGLSHPALFDTDDWREVAPADAPTPAPRGDFTSVRQ